MGQDATTSIKIQKAKSVKSGMSSERSEEAAAAFVKFLQGRLRQLDPRRVWVVKKLTTKHFSVDGRRFQMATGWDELRAETTLDAITVKNGIATVSLLEFVTKAFDAKDMERNSSPYCVTSEIDSQKTLGLGVRARDAAGISSHMRSVSPLSL